MSYLEITIDDSRHRVRRLEVLSMALFRTYHRGTVCFATAAALLVGARGAHADESGIAFWLPGLYSSMAAVPGTPGWALGGFYYHTSVNASGAAAASREFQVGRFSPNVNLNLSLSLAGQGDLVFLAPSYTFATPVFGGQLAVSVASYFGRNSANIAGTLTATAGPLIVQRSGTLGDALVSYGDLIPTTTLKWHDGVNNYMVYVTGDVPVGDYDPNRFANIGIGHGAVDFGAGYTYLNPATATEFSGVAGFTYNFRNPNTQYQSGVDFHLDWGVSRFMSKQVFVGFAGYAYQQITSDFGQPAVLGDFRSRVFGIGPQIGYLFPIGDRQGFLGFRGYGEFDAANRPSGWNTWLTFSISSSAPSAAAPVKHLLTK